MAAIFHSPAAQAFGLKGWCINSYPDAPQENILMAGTWIPLIGSVIGALQLYQSIKTEKQFRHNLILPSDMEIYDDESNTIRKNKDAFSDSDNQISDPSLNAKKLRAIVEIATLGLIGPILFVIDMIVTIGRLLTQKADVADLVLYP